MITIVDPYSYNYHRRDLNKMYALRNKVFFERLGWDVSSENDLERDDYDEKNAFYILYKDQEEKVRACHRLIPMTEETMFDGPFKHTLPDEGFWRKPIYWECSRFAVDPDLESSRHEKGFRHITSEMFAALMQVGMEYDVEYFLALMFPEMERLLRKLGFLLIRLGEAEVNQEKVVVSAFSPSHYTFDSLVRSLPDTTQRTLWYTLNLAA